MYYITEHCRDIKRILIIEDSALCANLLKDKIRQRFEFEADIASCEKEALEKLSTAAYDLILANLHLPDSSGNFIGELIRSNYRVIVLTKYDNHENRNKIFLLPIVDYIVKSDPRTVSEYVIKVINRLIHNKNTVIGICDDSKYARRILGDLIETQNLPYVEFVDGKMAYDLISSKTVKIDLLLTDYEMPNMNGLELIQQLRYRFTDDELPIISISASDKPHLVIEFLKSGADDYLHKPFSNEEFLTRINRTLNNLYTNQENKRLIQKLKESANKDFLSDLYNRNFFFSQIQKLLSHTLREKRSYAILMIDIDFFKKVNDTFGHHAGDNAIQHLAQILKNSMREGDYCFRWGGEEFLILIPNASSQEETVLLAERIRKIVETSPVVVDSDFLTFPITISIGGALGDDNNVESVIAAADEHLYTAKKGGRNCVKMG